MSTDHLVQMATLALKGKTVMITGAAGDIGGAMATLFRRAGCNLVLTARNKANLDEFVSKLPTNEGSINTYVCDLLDKKQVDDMIASTVNGPRIDILINNAGLALEATRPFWEQDLDNINSVLNVNVSALLNITHGVLNKHFMLQSPPRGTILNISSITGHQAPPKESFESSYHTSKAAVEAFSNVLRNETVGTNIRVLINRPGFVETQFHQRRKDNDPSQAEAALKGVQPLQPEDIAESVLWQCLQPERISAIIVEVLPTSQRSEYAADYEYEKRNA